MSELSVVKHWNVHHCARCRQDHEKLEFRLFAGEPIVDNGHVWNYWAVCPVSGDPILGKLEPPAVIE